MAVLSKIRQRSALLIGVIGFCLLAFVIGDLFQSNLFNKVPNNVGSVNGEDIAFEDFRVKVDNLEKSGQGVTSIQAVNRVWDEQVNVALLSAEFEKLGLRASDEGIMEILKQSQDIGQNPLFLNDAGKFDQAKFDEFFKANKAQKQMLDDRKESAALNAKFQQYGALIKGGLYTTAAEGKLKYEMETNKVTFDYVAVLYSTVKDSDVKISDDEIVAYMKKDEKRYKSDEVREVEYVLVEDKPSKADEEEVKKEVTALLEPSVRYNEKTMKSDTIPGFRNAPDVAEFVNSNSDVPYDSTFVAKKNLPAAYAEQLFNLPKGEVFGPYEKDGYYCLTKSVAREAGAQARASHILIAYKGAMRAAPTLAITKEEAQAKANGLLAQINANPNSFPMLAMTNSDDPGSKQQGGDLNYFGKGQMTPKFNDFVFNSPVGKVGMVETEFGFHIIKVTEKQDAVRLATIARKIEASEATSNEIFTTASKFEVEAANKSFDQLAKQYKLTVNPPVKLKPLDENFGAVGPQRQIARWAFEKETEVGSVKRFDVANVGHVIAKLKKINPEGLMNIEDARLGIEPILKNKKKAEKIKASMKGASLAAVAAASKSAVQNAVDLTVDSGLIPNIGQEQKVVGTAFVTPVNTLSAPIEGMAGVFVVQTKAVTKAPPIKNYKDYAAKLQAVNASAAGRILAALKENADIKDNRSLFY